MDLLNILIKIKKGTEAIKNAFRKKESYYGINLTEEDKFLIRDNNLLLNRIKDRLFMLDIPLDYKKYWTNDNMNNIIPKNHGRFPEGFHPGILIRELLKDIDYDKILDFGCAYGRLSDAFEPEKYIGIDLNPYAIEKARKNNPDYKYMEIDIDSEYPKADVAFAHTVFLHNDDNTLLSIIKRLKKAGIKYIVISDVINKDWHNGFIPPTYYRSLEEYNNIMSKSGFDFISETKKEYKRYKEDINYRDRNTDLSFLIYHLRNDKKQDGYTNSIEYIFKHNEQNEKSYIKTHYKDFHITLDEYKNLIKNLDDKSVITISKIINRIKLLLQNDNIKYSDILSIEEISSVQDMQNEFYNAIVQLDNGLYAYKNYILPVSHFEHNVFYFNHNMDEKLNYDYFKNKNIIDLGAYVGDSAIVLSKYTNKNVISFEGSPINFELLQKTLKLNNITNVIPENYAISDETKIAFYTPYYSSAAHIIPDSTENKVKINTITLDEYVEKNNIDVGLIKVDIEGAEQSFLRGAKHTISSQKPTLLISIYYNASDLIHIKPLIESWNLGYKFKIEKSYNGYIFAETTLICEVEQ